MVSSEHIARVNELREKARHGEMSLDDCREAIKFLRAEREALPGPPSKTKKSVNVDDLFNELDNL